MNRHGKIAEGQTRISVQVTDEEKRVLTETAKAERRYASVDGFISPAHRARV